MQGQFLIIGSSIVIALIIVIVILHFIRKAEMKYYRNKVKKLEIQMLKFLVFVNSIKPPPCKCATQPVYTIQQK